MSYSNLISSTYSACNAYNFEMWLQDILLNLSNYFLVSRLTRRL